MNGDEDQTNAASKLIHVTAGASNQAISQNSGHPHSTGVPVFAVKDIDAALASHNEGQYPM